MKKTTTLFLLLVVSLLFTKSAQATVYKSIHSGPWEQNYVWDQNTPPGVGDTVIIDGDLISLQSSVTIAELIISNNNGTNQSELMIDPNIPITVTITGNLYLTAEDYAANVGLQVRGETTFDILGNVTMTRAANAIQGTWLRLYLYGKSKTSVSGSLDVLYKNSLMGEATPEIHIQDKAVLNVARKTSLIMEEGESLEFIIQDSATVNLDSLVMIAHGGNELLVQSTEASSVNIGNNTLLQNSGASIQVKLSTGFVGGQINMEKDLTIVSTGDERVTIVETRGPTAGMEVKGNINLTAEYDSTVYLNVLDQSTLILGGSITRGLSNSFGNLVSNDGGKLVLNGSGQQFVPGSSVGSVLNQDQFSIGNVVFSNTSGLPITLEGDLVFTDTVTLTTGNIVSSEAAMMILGPNAVVKNASENAYIEGPMKKIGSTGGDDFVFPIGNSTTYAPMRISPVTTPGSQYIARYDGDPPPFGENKIEGVEQVTGNQTWSLEPTLGSDSVKITLYWDDATAMGVELEQELIVVGLDENNYWNSLGNTDVSLTSPGHVTSLTLGDPPPFGEHFITLGLAPEGSLPVDLTKFGAVQQKEKVYLEWHTSSEINVSHFELQRSTDQENFNTIYSTNSVGADELSMKYATLDATPAQGMNYYRLKMVDQDGSFEYSHVEVVAFEKAAEIMIYPNPVMDVLQIEGGTDTGMKTFEVYDRNGLLLHQGLISFEDGKFEISVDEINVSASGTYFFRIIDGMESKVVKFLKIK